MVSTALGARVRAVAFLPGLPRWCMVRLVVAGIVVLLGLTGLAGNVEAIASGSSGAEVVLRAEGPSGTRPTNAELERSVEIIRDRLTRAGLHASIKREAGSPLLAIRFDGLSVPAALRNAAEVATPGLLEFYDLETSLVPPSIGASQQPVATTSLFGLLASVQSGQTGLASQYYLFNSRTKKPLAGPTETLAQLKHNPTVKALRSLHASAKKNAAPLKTTKGFPTGYQLLTVPAKRVVVTCDAKTSVVCPGLNTNPAPGVTYHYLFKHDLDAAEPAPQMTGNDLKLKGTQQDFDPNGAPIVTMQFKSHGNKIFHEITRQEAIRGQTLGTPQHFAIVLDNQIRSWPQIEYQKYPDGIDPSNGGIEITGLSSLSDAKRIADVLQTGVLPLTFRIASARAVN